MCGPFFLYTTRDTVAIIHNQHTYYSKMPSRSRTQRTQTPEIHKIHEPGPGYTSWQTQTDLFLFYYNFYYRHLLMFLYFWSNWCATSSWSINNRLYLVHTTTQQSHSRTQHALLYSNSDFGWTNPIWWLCVNWHRLDWARLLYCHVISIKICIYFFLFPQLNCGRLRTTSLRDLKWTLFSFTLNDCIEVSLVLVDAWARRIQNRN